MISFLFSVQEQRHKQTKCLFKLYFLVTQKNPMFQETLKIEPKSSSHAMRLFSFGVVTSYNLCNYDTAYEKVKFVQNSMVSYKIRFSTKMFSVLFF